MNYQKGESLTWYGAKGPVPATFVNALKERIRIKIRDRLGERTIVVMASSLERPRRAGGK